MCICQNPTILRQRLSFFFIVSFGKHLIFSTISLDMSSSTHFTPSNCISVFDFRFLDGTPCLQQDFNDSLTFFQILHFFFSPEYDIINVLLAFKATAQLQGFLNQSMANGETVLSSLGQSIPGALHSSAGEGKLNSMPFYSGNIKGPQH